MSSQNTISLSSSWEAVSTRGYDRELAEMQLKKQRELEQKRQNELQDKEHKRQEKAENEGEGTLLFAESVIEELAYSAKFRQEAQAFFDSYQMGLDRAKSIMEEEVEKANDASAHATEMRRDYERRTLNMHPYGAIFQDENGNLYGTESGYLDEEQTQEAEQKLKDDPSLQVLSFEKYEELKAFEDRCKQEAEAAIRGQERVAELKGQFNDLMADLESGKISEAKFNERSEELIEELVDTIPAHRRAEFVNGWKSDIEKLQTEIGQNSSLEPLERGERIQALQGVKDRITQAAENSAPANEASVQESNDVNEAPFEQDDVSAEAVSDFSGFGDSYGGGAYGTEAYGSESYGDEAYDNADVSAADNDLFASYYDNQAASSDFVEDGGIQSSISLSAVFAQAHDNSAPESAQVRNESAPQQERAKTVSFGGFDY